MASPRDHRGASVAALACLIVLGLIGWMFCPRASTHRVSGASEADALAHTPEETTTEPLPTEAPPVGCEPPCGPGSRCQRGACRALTEESCGALARCDGVDGSQCFDPNDPCDTGFFMTPCQSPGRRECRDGVVVCVPRGRTVGGCSPPGGGQCDPNAQCVCPPDRPSSCADWWARPGQRACVDMSTDDTHCGACDRVCDGDGVARSVCRLGRCVCPEGTTTCEEPGERALHVRCRRACSDAGGYVNDIGSDATDANDAIRGGSDANSSAISDAPESASAL